jgi:hypothetical protein
MPGDVDGPELRTSPGAAERGTDRGQEHPDQ